jgi:tetratricopeptide (TPR) repeat protein
LLRRLRQQQHALSVRQIAARAGVSGSHVSDVLRGWKTPSPEVAAALARVLGGGDGDIGKVRQWAGQARELQYYQRTHPAPAGHSPPSPPRELPTGVPHFTGRAEELKTLTGLLDQPGEKAPGTVVISAIGGTAGVGKTALAVHWAHQAAGRFPDGQLYVNLRGYDPAQPMRAADALTGFLRSLGVSGKDIPPEAGERAARFRSLVSGRRMLIVLDNAGSADQVRPLLPGTPACTVLVTSRDALGGLVAMDGATRLDLDVLPLHEAVALLRTLIGARVDAEPEAAAELASQCCRLPLALRVAAEMATSRPAVPLSALAGELADLRTRLDLLGTGGDPRTEVRTVFSWSYLYLDTDAARTFRLAGLHPGPDLEPYAAAALTGSTTQQARQALDVLARAHLLYPASPGRYGMYDLLRGYARELASAEDDEDQRHAALTRLFDHHLHTAATAMDILYPADRHHRPRIAQSAIPLPPLDGCAAAREWLDCERATLVAVAGHCAAHGWPGHATRLAATIARYLLIGGHFPEAVTIFSHALGAARRTGDRAAQAMALYEMGHVHWWQCRFRQAADHCRDALALFRAAGDRTGAGHALTGIGLSETDLGHYEQAALHQLEAIAIYRALGDRLGEARALGFLGLAWQRQGRYQEAAGYHRQSLGLFREIGDGESEAFALARLGRTDLGLGRQLRAAGYLEQALTRFHELGHAGGECETLGGLGYAYLGLGRHEQAADIFERALVMSREIGAPILEADALDGLGKVLIRKGEVDKARAHHAAALAIAAEAESPREQARYHWQQALTCYTTIGAPEADELHAQLCADDARQPSASPPQTP